MNKLQEKTLEELYHTVIKENNKNSSSVAQENKPENFKKFSLYDFSKYETSVSAVMKN